jgi:hypothetical protein
VLLSAVAVLGALSLAAQATREWAHGSVTANALHFFNATYESTVPTLFSALLLLACAGCAAALASSGIPQRRRWWLLCAVLIAFTVDESVGFHEATMAPLRRLLDAGGVLYYTWVVPGTLFVVLAVAAFGPLARELAGTQRRLFAAAAALYFGGALGLEFAGGWVAERYGETSAQLLPLSAAEEILEMVGAVLFLYVLMERLGPWHGTLRLNPR